jgi:predicted DNA repair protein MutK
MAIALASLEQLSLATTALALVVVAVAITVGVYGVVALIVKLDDIGLHLAQRRNVAARRVGIALVNVVPKMLSALSAIGTAAMLWVGGGILLHGLEDMPVAAPLPEAVHRFAVRVGEQAGIAAGLATWLVNALGGAVAGLVVGGIIVAIVRRFTRRPEELIVD